MNNAIEKIRVVKLSKYHPTWPAMFANAASEIKSILKENCLKIHHFGSTTIPNIYPKPIIDILPVVKDISLVDSLNYKFEALGYVCMGEYGIPGRRYYWKSKIKRTHHIHLFEQGSLEILRHIVFKNFMLAHVDYAQAYSFIKRCLAEAFPFDIKKYVNGKASFIQMIDYKTDAAKESQIKADDNIVIEPYHPVWVLLKK